MKKLLPGMMIGLLWAGPNWAGDDFCAAHGRMAEKLAAARVKGVSKADAQAAVLQPHLPPHVRELLASTVDLAYASTQAPDEVAAQAEALCRAIFPH